MHRRVNLLPGFRLRTPFREEKVAWLYPIAYSERKRKRHYRTGRKEEGTQQKLHRQENT